MTIIRIGDIGEIERPKKRRRPARGCERLRGLFTGPGPLNGKTALLNTIPDRPGFVIAQFDDRDLSQPNMKLTLRSPEWSALGFGWHLFQARFFRIAP